MALVKPKSKITPTAEDKARTYQAWKKYADRHTVDKALKHYKISKGTYFNYKDWYENEYLTGTPREKPVEIEEVNNQEAFLRLYREHPFELLTCEELGISEEEFQSWLKEEGFKKKLEYTKRVADELAKKRMRDIGMGLIPEDELTSKANPTALEKYIKLDRPESFASPSQSKGASKDNKPSRIKINVKAGIR